MLSEEHKQIIVQYMPMAKKAAGEFYSKYHDKYSFTELESMSYEALIRAVPKYKESKKANMTTYLHQAIRWHLNRIINEDKWYLCKQADRGSTKNTVYSYQATIKEDYRSELADKESNVLNRLMVEEALELLPEKQKTIIKLKYLEGLTFDQIGEIFGFTRNAAYEQAKRAIRNIQRHWLVV